MLLTGSAGGGKSRLAGERMHAYMMKYPGAMGLMLRKTRNSMTNSTVLFLDRSVIGNDASVKHYPSKSRFQYNNGSILAYGGMANDEQREQIRSIGQDGSVDIAWMEEATKFTEDDYNEIRARIRGRAADWRQVVLTTNPDAPTHWINQRLIKGGEASVHYSSAADNEYNPPEYIDTLKSLTGVLGLRLRDGKWVQAEGAVYDIFDAGIHIIDGFPIPADWRRIRAIDFGYTNAFVCQWWAIDNDGRMYLYREMYHTRRTVNVHAAQIKRLTGDEYIEATVTDHDAEDRATLEEFRILTTPAKKDVSPGIQAVTERLKIAGDGKPRLFIFRDALVEMDTSLESAKKPSCTADEIDGYVWPKTADGRAVKEQPVKVNDHGLDTLRYAVQHVDNDAGPLLLW
ncbi:MAG: terminase [Planctomycetaceae bacterium]|nr:terminase [Planctomycetaceae bacterium]